MILKFVNYSGIMVASQARRVIMKDLKSVFEDDLDIPRVSGNNFIVGIGKGKIKLFFNLLYVDCVIIFYKDGKVINTFDIDYCGSFPEILQEIYDIIANY